MFRARPESGIAWITGASSGIGRALALNLAARGYRVAATARRTAELEALRSSDNKIMVYPGDVTDAARMVEVVSAIEREQGPIALAVLNAGAYDAAERRGFDAARDWRTIETNLGGTMRCLDPVLAAMLPRGRGQIALTASLAGYGGIPGSLAYGAAKSAIITMAEALRLTYAPAGLTVQVINPGFVATEMTAGHDYKMPFMLSAEAAAERIYEGLQKADFEIAFPRRLVWTMKTAALLPYPLWLQLMARATRRVRRLDP